VSEAESKPKPGPPAQLIGPLFGWELVRLARRGQDFRARFLLAAGLLLVLTIFTIIWFRATDLYQLFFGTSSVLGARDSARFGEQFTVAFLLAQIAILVLLTPAYAAGAISEEKERKTFIYLLISELSNREIVFGKFLGRLTFLLGVMLAGLPVLALTQVYGGTSEKFLLMGYLITACTVIMLAAVSAAAAMAVDTYRGALFRAYGFAALHSLVGGIYPLFSPFAFIPLLWSIETDNPPLFWTFGLLYCGVELLIAVIAIVMAVLWVRRMRAQPVRRKPPTEARKKRSAEKSSEVFALSVPESPIILEETPPIALGEGHRVEVTEPVQKAQMIVTAATPTEQTPPVPKFRRPKVPKPRRFEPPDDHSDKPPVWSADPFLWKETYSTGLKRTADDDQIRGVFVAIGVSAGMVFGFLFVISLLTILFSGFSKGGIDAAFRILIVSGMGGFFTYLLVIGAAAAGSIVRERQRLTLESLLTIPVSKQEILWPKWRVSVTRAWWWGLPITLLLPFSLLFSQSPLTAAPAFVLVIGSIPLMASYGLWLSLRCKTMTRAVLWAMPLMGFLALLPVLLNWIFSDWLVMNFSLLAFAALITWLGAVLFWFLTLRDFEPERQLA
jgi:ABC-type transport system involved in multi-copper enzyme maturation permease subunit